MSVIIRATYSVSTPLFSGGANPDQPEIRLSSFKGVLRYWWRVLAWSTFGGDLEQIRREELKIFGSSGAEGQSQVLMRLKIDRSGVFLPPRNPLTRDLRAINSLHGAYYLGYGLVHSGGKNIGQIIRGAIVPPIQFSVEMFIPRRNVSGVVMDMLIDALKAIGLMGGMGARSRRGFGSLVLRRLTRSSYADPRSEEELWTPARNADELTERLESFRVNNAPDRLPEYTAMSPSSRVVIVEGRYRDALRLLDAIGRELMLYRGWGRGCRVAGFPSERRFPEDHHLMRELRKPANAHPRRIAFGLPHNYHFSSLPRSQSNRSVGPQGPPGKRLDRRASPLFIHIHMCENTPVGVLTFLPAVFLPNGSRIVLDKKKRIDVELEQDASKFFQPVEEFLDRFLGRSQANRPVGDFGRVFEVTWA